MADDNVATMPAIERNARILAGRELSAIAERAEVSAPTAIDGTWQAYREDAVSILRTLREPDEAMAAAGDPQIWSRMISAALVDGGSQKAAVSPDDDALEVASEPLIEGP